MLPNVLSNALEIEYFYGILDFALREITLESRHRMQLCRGLFYPDSSDLNLIANKTELENNE